MGILRIIASALPASRIIGPAMTPAGRIERPAGISQFRLAQWWHDQGLPDRAPALDGAGRLPGAGRRLREVGRSPFPRPECLAGRPPLLAYRASHLHLGAVPAAPGDAPGQAGGGERVG